MDRDPEGGLTRPDGRRKMFALVKTAEAKGTTGPGVRKTGHDSRREDSAMIRVAAAKGELGPRVRRDRGRRPP